MKPRNVMLVAKRVVRQLRRDRRTLALIFVVPTMMVLLLGLVLRAGEGKLTLLVAAEDARMEAAATTAAGALRGVGPADMAIEAVELSEGYERLRVGEAEGMLVLPAEGDPRLVLEGTRPPVTEVLTRFAQQAALMLRSARQGQLPGDGPAPELEREFVRAGPELDVVDGLAPAFISFFGYLFVFLLTSVAFLRERQQGTLERLMITPVGRLEILAGYMLGLGFFALLQAFVIVTVTVVALQIHMFGNLVRVFLTVALLTLGAVNLGILASTYARNEFQVVQFMPMLVVTQALLSATFFPLAGMPNWIIWLSKIMPMTYAVEAVRAVMVGGSGIDETVVWRGMLVLLGFALLFLVAGARTLRRGPA